ncbi:nucleotide exchange factor GrpE [Membranicola marinus]|uniref:Protein GrpE n=1 Tax=Membranihabitans marinus TaxID=1227546 RepID=A0A953L805_9BACT|nr:nucleotide exchange factor GrpE [Membranihabitans marinus]MBY5959277.1 nucleotide exchange factor GrpE [Membranihabitans marinus]
MSKKRNNQTDEETLDQDVNSDKQETTADSDSREETNTVSDLETEIQELRDKYLRLFAEFDNFKKRSLREKIEQSKMAGQEVIQALLPVLDDFDRAKKNADDPENEEYFSEGVELVYNKLYQTLQQQGLEVMDPSNIDFDPELHDAIADIEVQDESLKGKIIDYIEKGYLLNGKIIRHAKVVVGKR